MNISVVESITQAQGAAIESILMVSKVYLDSTERLTQLNMDVLRDSVNDGTAAFCALTGVTAGASIKDAQSEIVVPMFERAMAYARNVQELASETQDQVAQLANARMSELKKVAKLSA
ncbi:hypothetical protein CEW87_20170 [Parazoarcus communis]|jgi:phasin family protein|uniref:Phasin domain-containing protein n=1 Tax=Parazoarcus communis TaxID=41977 RepID=A0A2U8H6A1_9RHOO|nr:phasin family protein [Parazoarcus communis]AWI81477.1 hypothetical protein CEW87_20170 [Parazoarcus communis]